MNDVIVYFAAAFFFGMGAMALIKPPSITGMLSLPVIPSDMRNEVRAVYGGFGVAMAAVLVAATRVEDIRSGVLLTVGLALVGMGSGRAISFAVDRSTGGNPYLFMVGELLLGGALLYVRVAS